MGGYLFHDWMNIQKLVKGCQAQKPEAQRILYERYSGPLMGICLRYGRSREDAEDIFQEAFIRIFQQIDQLREAQALPAWVKRLTVNTAINHYRKQKRLREQGVGELDLENHRDMAQSPEILDQLDNEALLLLINKLPDGYRIIFNLYVIEGYSHKEIAEVMNTSENSSKSQLYKAKKALKKMICELNLIEDERRA